MLGGMQRGRCLEGPTSGIDGRKSLCLASNRWSLETLWIRDLPEHFEFLGDTELLITHCGPDTSPTGLWLVGKEGVRASHFVYVRYCCNIVH